MHARHAAVVAAALMAPLLAAGRVDAAGPQGRHPEWFGYYHFVSGSELGQFRPEIPDDAALRAVITEHLQPWARLKMLQTNGVADDTGAICQLDGIFRIPIRGGGFMWLPSGADRILIVSSHIYSAGVRRVHLDRPHPTYPSLTWLGDSVGRWDGDVMVVDTVGFNDKSWLTDSMHPHTEFLHVVERYRLAAPDMMEVRTTVEDRQALVSPYSYSRYYKRVGTEVPETICNADPGEQRMWTGFRMKARKDGMRPLPVE